MCKLSPYVFGTNMNVEKNFFFKNISCPSTSFIKWYGTQVLLSVFTREINIFIFGTLIYYFIYVKALIVGDMCDDVFQVF